MICFAKSMAGHDKDEIYFIQEDRDGFLYLVNGTSNPCARPKKKNPKHVQIIKKLDLEILNILSEEEPTDRMIAKAIAVYEKNRKTQLDNK
ncbi:MAG: KOW domain-containing protein [Lachnospiraceae bacterium]